MSETVSTEKTPQAESAVSVKKDSVKKSSDSSKAPKKSFFKGVKAEFKKIIWPEKMVVVKRTTAVVLVTIFCSIAVKVSDLVIQAVLDLLIG